MKKILALALVLLVGRPFQDRVAAQQPPRATVYEGASLIDGNGGPAIENFAFVVADTAAPFTQCPGRRGRT